MQYYHEVLYTNVLIFVLFAFEFAIFSQIQTQSHYRIYSDQEIILSRDGQDISFPSGSRVTEYENSWLIYNHKSAQYELFKPSLVVQKQELSTQTTKSCLEKSNLKLVFLNEAWSAIKLVEQESYNSCTQIFNSLIKTGNYDFAKKYENCSFALSRQHKEFDQFIKRLKAKLIKSQGDTRFSDKLKKKLLRYDMQISNLSKKTNVEQISYVHKMIFNSYNPVNKTGELSKKLMMVPLSHEWFKSHPMLYKWYLKSIKNQSLPNVFLGGSGEGISRTADDFDMIATSLMNLKRFVDDFQIYDSESMWLRSKSFTELKNINHFIFLHDQTWYRDNFFKNEYIPIEQSLSCFRSDPVISTLIHEVNVNSDNFFPTDTHFQVVDSNDVFEELGLAQLDFLTARQSYIQLIYIDYILRM